MTVQELCFSNGERDCHRPRASHVCAAARDCQALDAEAAVALHGGDRRAAAALYQRHLEAARRVALVVLRSEADADDVVQDAFIGFLARPWMYVPERGDFSSWFRRTVRNAALDRARKRVRRRAIERDVIRHELPEQSTDEPPARPVSTSELHRIRAALDGMASDKRVVVEAAFGAGLTHGEIARRNGIPLGTVKARLYRAVRALRKAVDEAAA